MRPSKRERRNCKAPLRLLAVERKLSRRVFERSSGSSSRSIGQPEASAKFVFKKARQADNGHRELDKRIISNRPWFKRFAPIFDALAAANQHNSPLRSIIASARVRSQGRSYSSLQNQDASTLFSPPPPLRVALSEPSSDRAGPRTVLCCCGASPGSDLLLGTFVPWQLLSATWLFRTVQALACLPADGGRVRRFCCWRPRC